MRRRRTTIAALALGLSAALLAGCGGGTQPTGAGPEGGDEADGTEGVEEVVDPGDGTASAWLLTGGVHEALWSGSFDRWNDENPDREFNYELFANDPYKERIRIAVGADNPPTLIFGWGGGALQEYVDNGNVVDITDETQDVDTRVIESVADVGKIDGRTYAIANGQSQPVILYYNQELFDEVGAEVPTTWDELMTVVDTFNEADIAPFSVAGQSRWPYLMWIQYLTDRIGGPEVFQAVLDGEPDAWSHPAIAEALAKIQELVEADGFVSGYGSVVADANADLALIYTGRAAMMLQGSWVYSTFKADAEEFTTGGGLGYTTFPAIEDGAGDISNIVGNPSNYWSVASAGTPESQETATAYLNDILWDEEYTEFLLDGGGVPPVVGLEERIGQADDADFLTLAYEMVRDAGHFQLSWDQALPSAQAQELLMNLEMIFLLQSTPQDFVDAMNATIR